MRRRRTKTLYVTGKGGAGKSFLTALLAREAARRELATAVVQLVDEEAPGEASRPPRSAWIKRILVDQRAALAHLVTRLLRLPALARRLLGSRTFTALTAAAPGIKELVYLSYLADLAAGRTGERFDVVLADGLASGHTRALLEAPGRIKAAVPLGPLAWVLDEVSRFITDPKGFRVAVVSPAEELGAAETQELHEALAACRVPVTPTVVNGVYPPRLTVEQLAWVCERGASSDAVLYMNRRRRQLAVAERIASPAGPAVLVPYSFGPSAEEARTAARLYEALLEAWP